MERGLVLVEQTVAHRNLLLEAIDNATGTDASLVLLTTMTAEQFEDDAEILESIGRLEKTSYDTGSVLDRAVADIHEYVEADIPDSVETTIVARATNDPAQAALDVAAKHQCDHVYVHGSRRSPTGKAIFGDTAQQVALNFDGYVTIATN